MNFFELLNISPGVTAVIGSGGKTSLLRRLAAEAPGTVLLCTTTHIRPFAEYPLLTDAAAETVLQALTSERILCVGTPCENGKLTASADGNAGRAGRLYAGGGRWLPADASEGPRSP